MNAVEPPVVAAGALCWRMVDGSPKVLVVHRPRHDDWSLPKGKLDPGETPPEAAAREVAEETGFRASLGVPLGRIDYRLPGGRDKVVHYWAAHIDRRARKGVRFHPNDEVDEVRWLSLRKAKRKLSYEHDHDVVDRFAALVAEGAHKTFSVVALRHAKAVAHGDWKKADSLRPLQARGDADAETAARGIAAFRPRRIVSSDAVRCVSTVAPLAKLTGLKVRTTAGISQAAYENGQDAVAEVVAGRIRKGRSVVLCSHGPVLPEIVNAIAYLTGTPSTPEIRAAGDLATGAYSVFHLSARAPHPIVAVETHDPRD